MRPIKESLQEYAQGIVGGILFSIPILMTMEVWWRGTTIAPETLIIHSLVTLILLMGYNRYAGMHPESSRRECIMESFEEMGLALLLTLGMLLLTDRIEFSKMPDSEWVGRLVMEGASVAIGFSVGSAQLGVRKDKKEQDQGQDQQEENQEDDDTSPSIGNKGHLIIAFCGAILLGMTIAPTEEIFLLAYSTPPSNLLLTACFSILLSGIILYFSEFKGSSPPNQNFWYEAIKGTVISYAVALLAAGYQLWIFGRFDEMHFQHIVGCMVVLGVLTSLGSSAGRLLIKRS